jgi:hypothetical protein
MKPLYLICLVWTFHLKAAEFINLTFDNPDLTGSLRPVYLDRPNGPFWGTTRDLLRGWTLTMNGIVQTEMNYSPWPTGADQGGVDLRNYHPDLWSGSGGMNWVLVDSGGTFSGRQFSLTQSGTIPTTVAELTMNNSVFGHVLVNGVQIGTTYDSVLNISGFAGQEVTLEFRFLPGASGRFDIYGFTQIPEPSTWALFGVGAAAMAWMARKKR